MLPKITVTAIGDYHLPDGFATKPHPKTVEAVLQTVVPGNLILLDGKSVRLPWSCCE